MPLNLLDLLKVHRIDFREYGEDQHVSKSDWIGLECPWCHNPGKYHLGINPRSGLCTCWRCGRKPIGETLARICRVEIQTIWPYLNHHHRQPYKRAVRPEGFLKLPDNIEPMQAPHRKYLTDRGFNPVEIERLWGVQGIGIDRRFPWRLFIPIRNRRMETVSWTTRSISPTNPKRYMTANKSEESESIKSVLYGAEHTAGAVIVVEGPTDAWAIGPGAVATCGMILGRDQINRLARYPVRVICFDGSKDAQERAERLCRRLAMFPGRTEQYRLDSDDDPATADKSEIQDLREYVFGIFSK